MHFWDTCNNHGAPSLQGFDMANTKAYRLHKGFKIRRTSYPRCRNRANFVENFFDKNSTTVDMINVW